jgi:hypothetical protein
MGRGCRVVLEKQETAIETTLGAAVYTDARQLAGFIFEVCEHCVGIALCGGVSVWLGKPMIASIEGRSVFLASNLLRKHRSLHRGIHIHGGSSPHMAVTSDRESYVLSQAS